MDVASQAEGILIKTRKIRVLIKPPEAGRLCAQGQMAPPVICPRGVTPRAVWEGVPRAPGAPSQGRCCSAALCSPRPWWQGGWSPRSGCLAGTVKGHEPCSLEWPPLAVRPWAGVSRGAEAGRGPGSWWNQGCLPEARMCVWAEAPGTSPSPRRPPSTNGLERGPGGSPTASQAAQEPQGLGL